MSNLERQRILRRQGSKPAEAERQERAEDSREQLRVEQAAREAEGADAPEEPAPLAEREGDDRAPRPRR